MELSIWSSYFLGLKPEDMVCEFERQGIFFSELSFEHAADLLARGEAEREGCAFRRFADSHNVRFLQGHVTTEISFRSGLTDKNLSVLKRWLDLFYAAGVRRAVMHCDKNVSFDENVESFFKLCMHIKNTDMLLCIENTGTVNPISVDAKAILKLIRSIGSDNLGICLDTGHFHRDRAIAGEKSQQEFIHDAGRYLKALHIADNDGTSDQHKLPFGNPFGKNGVDFSEVVASLYDIGYDGLFNFEIPGESAGIPIELAKAKLPYIKSLYLYLMSQAREKSMEDKEII